MIHDTTVLVLVCTRYTVNIECYDNISSNKKQKHTIITSSTKYHIYVPYTVSLRGD
jgi:hypothetical protein